MSDSHKVFAQVTVTHSLSAGLTVLSIVVVLALVVLALATAAMALTGLAAAGF